MDDLSDQHFSFFQGLLGVGEPSRLSEIVSESISRGSGTISRCIDSQGLRATSEVYRWTCKWLIIISRGETQEQTRGFYTNADRFVVPNIDVN